MRLFLPNERGIEPQITAKHLSPFRSSIPRSRSLARPTPKRDYYQSRRGNRLFELRLGEVALAFTAASSKADQDYVPRGADQPMQALRPAGPS
jgi:type IV secretion system protein TrbE